MEEMTTGLLNDLRTASFVKDSGIQIRHLADQLETAVQGLLDDREVVHAKMAEQSTTLTAVQATMAKRARFGGEAAVVVDMECAAIAKLRCTRAPGAYLALRYVSDNADHDAGTSWDNEVRKAAIAFDQALVVLAGI